LAFGELGSFKELKIATRRGHAYRQIEEKSSIATYQSLKKVFRSKYPFIVVVVIVVIVVVVVVVVNFVPIKFLSSPPLYNSSKWTLPAGPTRLPIGILRIAIQLSDGYADPLGSSTQIGT